MGQEVMLLQRLSRRPSWEVASIYAWAATEVVLLTGFLFGANGPSRAMAIGYLLLVAASVLRGRPMLIWVVPVLPVAGYPSLIVDAHWSRPHLAVPAYHGLYYALSVCVMGLMMHFVLRRVRSGTSDGQVERFT